MLLCRYVLLCMHLWDPVPHFRRHPFLDLGLESVCVCVCVRFLFLCPLFCPTPNVLEIVDVRKLMIFRERATQ